MITLRLLETIGPRPTSIYAIELGGKKIGIAQLRHTPGKGEDMPAGFENHVYGEINPEFRRRGYAKEAFRLLLDEARKVGLPEIIVTAAEENVGSCKVIEASGGVFLDKKPQADGTVIRKYKMAIKSKE